VEYSREFGATDVVAERGEEGVTKVRELTGGRGTHAVLECVGYMSAYEMAYGIVRPGGVISRVGVPQYQEAPIGFAPMLGFGSMFGQNIRLAGGPGAQRPYIEELLPEVLDGHIEPGKVFDRTVSLDDTAEGYTAMDKREALKVLVRP
jgi:threonine dehydrogenase-like Zn-dependent dehydrogenase